MLGKSIEVLENINPKKFDLVFVDGDHSWENVLPEFKAVERVLAANGTIVYHDAIHMEAPKKITSYAKFYGYNVVYLKTPEGRGISIINKL
jgi:predicted O-methyltransferase YrrM